MQFTIETNVSKPTTSRGRKATEFPFAQMEVGQSFLIPISEEADARKKGVDSWRRKLLNAKKRFAETHTTGDGETKPEFTTAVMKEGLRVWRAA